MTENATTTYQVKNVTTRKVFQNSSLLKVSAGRLNSTLVLQQLVLRITLKGSCSDQGVSERAVCLGFLVLSFMVSAARYAPTIRAVTFVTCISVISSIFFGGPRCREKELETLII